MLAKLTPTAVVLDLGLPDMDGERILEFLRSDPATADIPVHVISARDRTSLQAERTRGRFTQKPVDVDTLDAILADLGRRPEGGPWRVLVVDDVESERRATAELLEARDVEIVQAASGADAMDRLRTEHFDGIVLDFQLGDTTAPHLLAEFGSDGEMELPPVVIYTARELSEEEHSALRAYTHAVVVKGALATERLLDEVSLFLHSVDRILPATERLAPPASTVVSLAGRKVLVVDDDLRNSFALSRSLRAEGLDVTLAENGQVALEKLAADPSIELVVMDMMMPVMDGLEATRRIRAREEWADLPVIALTAGAMAEHRAQSFEAGVDEHLTKPIDMDRLLAAIRLWLFRA
jgi:CheY-like chemotaxis protein